MAGDEKDARALAWRRTTAHTPRMVQLPKADFPDGLDASHVAPIGGLHKHASLLAFLLLGGFLGLASLGGVGGKPAPVLVANAPAAALQVKVARPLRSGVFFETRIRVVALRDIAKPVIGVDAGLWTDLTINSHIPAAASESFADGQYRFEYEALQKGETLEVKIDGQVNPPLVGRLAGAITLLDDRRKLAGVTVSVPVLP